LTASIQTLPLQLNTAQLELLQLFAGGLSDDQLDELRRILLDFKLRRVTALADKFVDEKGWTSKDIAKDAKSIERRPYRRNKKPGTANAWKLSSTPMCCCKQFSVVQNITGFGKLSAKANWRFVSPPTFYSNTKEIIARKRSEELAELIIEVILLMPNLVRVETYFNFGLPIKDPDDQKFTDCAIACGAAFLVTEDRDFNEVKKNTISTR
jgi:hypothetical protein